MKSWGALGRQVVQGRWRARAAGLVCAIRGHLRPSKRHCGENLRDRRVIARWTSSARQPGDGDCKAPKRQGDHVRADAWQTYKAKVMVTLRGGRGCCAEGSADQEEELADYLTMPDDQGEDHRREAQSDPE